MCFDWPVNDWPGVHGAAVCLAASVLYQRVCEVTDRPSQVYRED